jgi:hypothetical protein
MRKSFTVTFSAIYTTLAFILISLPIMPAHAADRPFLTGYTQALLDEHFPKLNLSVLTADASGVITLSADQCITAQQRAQVSSLLTDKKRINDVDWELPCKVTQKAQNQKPPVEKKRKVVTLPNTKIFRPLLADQREPRFAGYYQYHASSSEHFNAGAATFGEEFGLLRGHFHHNPYQLGIEAAVFALFNLDTKSHDLVNADYMVGIPLTYRTGDFSYRARIYHISSHLGDEFLLNNPGVHRVNLSYEITDFLASWSHWGVRLYGGGGAIVESDPNLKPAVVQFGAEYRYPHLFGPAELVAGANYKLSQHQDFGLNQSYLLGLAFHKGDHTVRTVLQYYTGFSPNGQFYTEQIHYFGVGLQFEL